jgi:predicted glycosyltransferase involved in capsule biosynthesis
MLSILLPIAGRNRKKYLDICIHFLKKQKFDNYEIILVEQVDCLLGNKRLGGPFYKNTTGIDKYIQIKDSNKNHFNQPWMENVGARYAKGKKLLFYDVDLICKDENYLEKIYEFDTPYFVAWNKMFCLTNKCSNNILCNTKVTNFSLENVYVSGMQKYAGVGFAVCIDKDFFFNKLGGYNENYLGWGGNDTDIAWRALNILKKEYKFSIDLYHLWHEKSYAKNLIHKRKSIWLTTKNNPHKITKRLKNANLGNIKKQTFINVNDIYIEYKK